MMDKLSTEEICRKLKPVFGKKIDTLYMKYALSENMESKQIIEHALNALYEKYLNTTLLSDSVLLEPPQSGIVQGEYPLGKISYADKEFHTFGLREKDWVRHVCISGMSGSGKTNLAFQVVGNFVLKKKNFLVFDWKKSFRPLLKVSDKIRCFTIGNNGVANLFKININEPPPGVGPKEWISILSDLINESFLASYGVQKFIRETLDEAFRDFGVYKGSENYPTWFQIKDRLTEKANESKGRRGRGAEWLESTLRIADALTYGNFGDAINHKDRFGMTVEELMEKQVVFELHALNNSEKKFFCEFILTYIYLLKKAANLEDRDNFNYAILVDEAHNIFLKDRARFTNETVTDMVYREIREYGVSLICLDQHISKLSDAVSGNSATNIAFQQMLPTDVECVSRLMHLSDHRNYFSMLPVGTAIVKLAERYYNPFLIKVPEIKLSRSNVSDNVVAKRTAEFVTEQKRLKLFNHECKEVTIQKRLKRMKKIYNKSGTDAKEKDLGKELNKVSKARLKKILSQLTLTKLHKTMLAKAKKSQSGISKLYSSCRLSARKGDMLKRELIEMGLLEIEEVRDAKGMVKIARPTRLGLLAVEDP